jgi:hypothetical protein
MADVEGDARFKVFGVFHKCKSSHGFRVGLADPPSRPHRSGGKVPVIASHDDTRPRLWLT